MSYEQIGALPRDKSNEAMQLLPRDYAKSSSVVSVTTTAQNITIPATATIISLHSNGATAYLKFSGQGTAAASASNFDEFVTDGARVDRQIPSECINTGTISIVGSAATSATILFM